jgi:hypothetical protein
MDNPGKAAIGASMAYTALQPTPDTSPKKHRQELKGRAHSTRTVNQKATDPGGLNYYNNNHAFAYTEDPSTYEMRYAEGGQVDATTPAPAPAGIAALPQAAPQGYIHPQYANPYQAGTNVAQQAQQIQAQMPQAPAAGIAALPVAPSTDVSKRGWLEQLQFDSPTATAKRASDFAAATALWNDSKAHYDQSTPYTDEDGGTRTINIYGGDPGPKPIEAVRPKQYAQGGALNTRPPRKSLPPMFLKGAGDGMSDSINASIDGEGKRPHEPIRVADGEYIVPADVVSHLGNGSSNAGSKKLDAMAAKARSARTGKSKQAPQVNTSRFIPR